MPNINHHLFEIKSRLFYLIFSTFCTFVILYHFKIEIVFIIGKPFVELQQTFIFLELTEAFYTLLKVSTIMTFLLLVPFLIYHFWSYFIPSFYKIERRRVNFIFSLFVCLWISEILLTYLILLPKICNFLISFEMISESNNYGTGNPIISLEFTARLESYVKLIVKISSLFFFLFQIPLCICLLYSKRLLHASSLYNNRKILSLFSLLISAFLVPPDVVSQLVIAFLFYLLFEILIFLGLFFE